MFLWIQVEGKLALLFRKFHRFGLVGSRYSGGPVLRAAGILAVGEKKSVGSKMDRPAKGRSLNGLKKPKDAEEHGCPVKRSHSDPRFQRTFRGHVPEGWPRCQPVPDLGTSVPQEEKRQDRNLPWQLSEKH